MATLNDKPNSSSKKQHSRLVIVAARKGVDLPELRRMVGGSLRRLSALQCSLWIESFSGQGLPNPPGQKPSVYSRKQHRTNQSRDREGAVRSPVRMILADHIDQIERLGLAYFAGDRPAFDAWLLKYHHVSHPREFATAAKATAIINVLKEMHTRKEAASCI
jgi:hypothetical protein